MNKQQIIALVFVLLMVGSVIASFLGSFNPAEEEVEVPQQRVLTYRLNDQQRKYLLTRGYTLIEFSYPPVCFECENQKVKLEDIVARSDGQVYLQELSGQSDSSTLAITSLKGQKTIEYSSDEKVRDTVCDMMLNAPIWCISGKI